MDGDDEVKVIGEFKKCKLCGKHDKWFIQNLLKQQQDAGMANPEMVRAVKVLQVNMWDEKRKAQPGDTFPLAFIHYDVCTACGNEQVIKLETTTATWRRNMSDIVAGMTPPKGLPHLS